MYDVYGKPGAYSKIPYYLMNKVDQQVGIYLESNPPKKNKQKMQISITVDNHQLIVDGKLEDNEFTISNVVRRRRRKPNNTNRRMNR